MSVEDRCTETRANRWRNDIYTLSQPYNQDQIKKALREFFKAPSVDDPFILWNTHKVYIRGLLIQMSAKLRRQRSERLTELLTKTSHLENLNKQKTTQNIREALFVTRQELQTHLVAQHDHQVRSLKALSYRYGNKAGKLLANQMKEKINKKSPTLQTPKSNQKLQIPKK